MQFISTPRDSTYSNPNIFDDLQTDITKFSSEGLIMLTGDLNARTGCALDYVDTDLCTNIPGDDNLLPLHTLQRRKNCESHITEHGQSLPEICEACDLRILNGRTTGDSFRKITFHSLKRISTVDYFIVSQELMNMCENHVVKEPTIFSNHSQLICWATISATASAPPIFEP